MTQGQLSTPRIERHLLLLALYSAQCVGSVHPSLSFSPRLSLHQHEVHDALVEDGILLLQGTKNDIEVREGARDVKKHVEVIFAERPLPREDHPKCFETPEVALDDHSSPPGVVVWTTDENRRNISPGASEGKNPQGESVRPGPRGAASRATSKL